MATLPVPGMQASLQNRSFPTPLSREMVEQFAERGFLSPFRVLTEPECQQFLLEADETGHPPPMDWFKGHAHSSWAFYTIATHPTIIEIVTSLLGEDIMLWGAHIVNRSPQEVHPWHTDMESSAPSSKSVSVWIGLEHTTSDSSLTIIPFSHPFGVTVQEVRHQFGKDRRETTDEEIVGWAQERDHRSHWLRPNMTNGEALFLDGRLWHSSHNLFHKTRRALLLQYSTPDTEILIPDLHYLDWPFQFHTQPRPPCLMVSGSDHTGVNRFVSPPAAMDGASEPPLTSGVYPLYLPLPPDENQFWKPYPLFRGSTADVPDLACHVSVLHQNQCPHPPHSHKEEELLLLLAGEVDLILPDTPGLTENQRMRLKPGQFVYYPPGFPHTLQTVSETPANYLMFKWYAPWTKTEAPLSFCHFSVFDALGANVVEDGFCARGLFEGPTACLRKLQCHTSTLTPGAGYDPHIDPYEVAIIVLEGEVETIGERVEPYGVIFYKAGEPHGIFNPGKGIAKYLVFELHGR